MGDVEGLRAGSGNSDRLGGGRRSGLGWPKTRRRVPHILQHLFELCVFFGFEVLQRYAKLFFFLNNFPESRSEVK